MSQDVLGRIHVKKEYLASLNLDAKCLYGLWYNQEMGLGI